MRHLFNILAFKNLWWIMACLDATHFYTAITRAAAARREIENNPDWIGYQTAKREIKELGQGWWNERDVPQGTVGLADLRVRRLFLRERQFDVYEKREKIVNCSDADFAKKLHQFKAAYSTTINRVVGEYRMWNQVLEYFALQYYDQGIRLCVETESRANKWYRKFECLAANGLDAHRKYLSKQFELYREIIRPYGVEDLHCSAK